jgi:hypothetical protein
MSVRTMLVFIICDAYKTSLIKYFDPPFVNDFNISTDDAFRLVYYHHQDRILATVFNFCLWYAGLKSDTLWLKAHHLLSGDYMQLFSEYHHMSTGFWCGIWVALNSWLLQYLSIIYALTLLSSNWTGNILIFVLSGSY